MVPAYACKLGILYPEKFKILTTRYPPNYAQNTPKVPLKTYYLRPLKAFSNFGNYEHNSMKSFVKVPRNLS